MSSQSVGRLARKQKAPDTPATISCRGDSRIALGGVVITEQAGDTNHRRPNNDSRGSKEKCSAGACPQLGEG